MKKLLIVIAVIVLALFGLGAFMFRHKDSGQSIQYKYTKVKRGEVAQSIQATGQIISLVQVDVKSKAGGIVEKLLVHVGSVVKKGQVIAYIDPTDTEAAYQQAEANLHSAQAKSLQAEDLYKLQISQSKIGVENAREALQAAIIQMERAKVQSGEQPALTQASIAQAKASYQSALDNLAKLQQVTIPQTRSDEVGAVNQTHAQYESDLAQFNTDQGLLAKGFISQNQFSKDKAAVAASKQAYELAVERRGTMENEISTDLHAQEASVQQAKALLYQAEQGTNDITLQKQNYAAAKTAVDEAKTALNNAIISEKNNEVKLQDVLAADDAIVGNQVAARNAKVQLESTTVTAPMDGVVTTRYLAAGTIIPPGTSLFSQGTSLVQVSDVSQLYVNCLVDEADISHVQPGQKVLVTAEAYKSDPVWGVVDRIDPTAVTTNNVTTITARVHILPDPNRKVQLLPGMNTTCEFITLDRQNVLYVPSEAIHQDSNGAYVLVKPKSGTKPVKTPVEVGVSGDDNVEIKSGLTEGEEVVSATINIKLDEEIQQQMQEDAQGGLAGGGRKGPKSYRTKTPKKPALNLNAAKAAPPATSATKGK